MKTSLCAVLCAFAVVPAAWANTPSSIRQGSYEADKETAIDEFGETQKSNCLQSLQNRYERPFHIEGGLAFNDRISEMIYDQWFWNSGGNMRRGLAFTAPVSVDERHGMLICYYSVTDSHLTLQDAFVLPFDSLVVSQP